MNRRYSYGTFAIVSVTLALAFCFTRLIRAQAKPPQVYKSISAHLGNISCTFKMKVDTADYPDQESILYWGIFTDAIGRTANYRCTRLLVSVGKQVVSVPEDVYIGLTNIEVVKIVKIPGKRAFAIHIGASDGADGYWGVINVNFTSGYNRDHYYSITSRALRNGEFPKRYYETTIYHME